MRNQWSNIKGLILISLIFMCVLLADIFLVYNYYRFVDDFLERQPDQIRADAGIIFFGDYRDQGTRLGIDSERRAKTAITLFRKGWIKSIVCVGGYEMNQWQGKPHIMKEYLLQHGVPSNKILHDSLSYNTITNWQEACKIIDKMKFRKVVAISAPLHLYRISKIIGSDQQVVYQAYQIQPDTLADYWRLFKTAHREWVSQMLSIALKDKLRNRIVHIYRTIWFEMDRVI